MFDEPPTDRLWEIEPEARHVGTAYRTVAQEYADGNAFDIVHDHTDYLGVAFAGSLGNSLTVPAFKAQSITVDPAIFVGSQMSFRPKFNMHPSAFVFPKAIADLVASRTGRFFWTNGVEYSAWPITAIFAKRILYIEAPLTVLGRTGKSWGTRRSMSRRARS